jgi:hypothetical protein
MTYQDDGWSKWTPQPREAPAWLKQMDLNAQHKKPLPFEKKQKYPLDALGLFIAFSLIMIAVITFVGALLK